MRRYGRKMRLRKSRVETQATDLRTDLREDLRKLLTALGGDPVKAKLADIWQQWNDILGEELAELAKPMGADKKQLLIGVEDALVMQEIQYRKQEILEKINLRLGEEYFENVRASILLGRETRETTTRHRAEPNKTAPCREESAKARGIYLSSMKSDSVVAKAYAIYAGKNKN